MSIHEFDHGATKPAARELEAEFTLLAARSVSLNYENDYLAATLAAEIHESMLVLLRVTQARTPCYPIRIARLEAAIAAFDDAADKWLSDISPVGATAPEELS